MCLDRANSLSELTASGRGRINSQDKNSVCKSCTYFLHSHLDLHLKRLGAIIVSYIETIREANRSTKG